MEIQTKRVPLVTLSKKVIEQINFMHHQAPMSIEWSGVLIFTDSGDLDENMIPSKINVIDLVPMDIGTSSYTEFNMACPQMTSYIMDNIDKEYKTGLIHTHHSMKAYFSGTDLDELRTNAKAYQYYLSLIVNYKHDIVAKIGVQSKTIQTTITDNFVYTSKGFMSQGIKEVKKEFYSCEEHDCKVVKEGEIDENFVNLFNLMQDEIERKKNVKIKNASMYSKENIDAYARGYDNQKWKWGEEPIIKKPLFKNPFSNDVSWSPSQLLIDMEEDINNAVEIEKADFEYARELFEQDSNEFIKNSELKEVLADLFKVYK
jgi:proteasome lid subunit RPN8/RPN11